MCEKCKWMARHHWRKESVNQAYNPFYIWHLSLNTIMSLEALECKSKKLLISPFCPSTSSSSCLSSNLPSMPPSSPLILLVLQKLLFVCILFSFSLFSSLLFFPLSISAGFLYPFLSCFLICSYPSLYYIFLVFSDIFTSLSWSSLLPPSILPSVSPLLSLSFYLCPTSLLFSSPLLGVWQLL